MKCSLCGFIMCASLGAWWRKLAGLRISVPWSCYGCRRKYAALIRDHRQTAGGWSTVAPL